LALCLPSEGGTSSTTQQRHPSYSFVHPELELCSQNTAKQDQLDEKVGVFFRCFFVLSLVAGSEYFMSQSIFENKI